MPAIFSHVPIHYLNQMVKNGIVIPVSNQNIDMILHKLLILFWFEDIVMINLNKISITHFVRSDAYKAVT